MHSSVHKGIEPEKIIYGAVAVIAGVAALAGAAIITGICKTISSSRELFDKYRYENNRYISPECDRYYLNSPLPPKSSISAGKGLDKLLLGHNSYLIQYAENGEPFLEGKIIRENEHRLNKSLVQYIDVLPASLLNPEERERVYRVLAPAWSSKLAD